MRSIPRIRKPIGKSMQARGWLQKGLRVNSEIKAHSHSANSNMKGSMKTPPSLTDLKTVAMEMAMGVMLIRFFCGSKSDPGNEVAH